MAMTMPDFAISKEIKDEHRIWKFNTLVLYDLVLSYTLEWPSLTVEWVSGINPKQDDIAGQTIIIGTHAAENEPNYILIIEIGLPLQPLSPSGMRYDQQQDYSGFCYGDPTSRKFCINTRIPHDGEINKATSNPFNSTIIATMSNTGDVYLFDSTKFGPIIQKNIHHKMEPLIKLKGHLSEGWGLKWHPHKPKGRLASVADDGFLCIWDINYNPKKQEIAPLQKLSYNKSPMQDLTWLMDKQQTDICLTVNDGGQFLTWDLRQHNRYNPSQKVNVSSSPLISISSNPDKPEILATGGADQYINVWDIRNLKRPIHCVFSHEEAIVRLQWSPQNTSILAAASSDRLITLWDLDRVGMEQTADDADDGPPELIFTHGGHTAPVSDISWNPDKIFPWMMASVSEDNILQIWEPAQNLLQEQVNNDNLESFENETDIE